MDQRRAFRKSILLGLVLTAFSLALHFLPIWETMLNRGAETWDGQPLPQDFIAECVQEHRLGPEVAFTRRPLMTWSVDVCGLVGVPTKTAFIGISFALFLAAGLVIRAIASRIGSSEQEALLAQACFHLSPTVLFAWFDPLYTYDEPMQYVALFGAMLLLSHHRHVLFTIAFAVALIAREPSLLLAPGFAILLAPKERWTVIVSILAYLIFLFWWISDDWMFGASLLDLNERPGFLLFNFHDALAGAESLCYLVLALALPVFLLARFQRSTNCTLEDRRLLRTFWASLLLNTVAVLVAAKAREARLFALPLIFGWPLIGKALMNEFGRYNGLRSFLSFLTSPLRALEFVVSSAVITIGVMQLFVLSTGIGQDNLFHEYLIAELLLILACLHADRYTGSRFRAA